MNVVSDKLIADMLSNKRGQRFLAWAMMEPIRGKGTPSAKIPLWEGYPDSPVGTLEIYLEEVGL